MNRKFFLIIVMISCFGASCQRKNADMLNMEFSQQYTNFLKLDVATLADDKMEGREAGTKGEKMAAAYIKERMKRIGLIGGNEKGFYQDFNRRIRVNPHSTEESPEDQVINVRNVVGMLDNGAKGYIVIGAHYDHLGYGEEGSLHIAEKAIHNGADDNASGVAIMLDLAQKLVTNDLKESHNILFVAFSGEEKGLWGSNYYAKNTSYEMSQVSYMLNMDMVGRLNADKSVAVHGVGTSPVFSSTLDDVNKYAFKLVKSKSGIGPSDHTSFYLEDVPVLHFFTGQHENYHRPSDDEQYINYQGMEMISDFMYQLIIALNDDGDLVFVKTKDESQKVPRFKVTLGVIPDYLFDGKGMRIDGVKEGRPAANAGIRKGDIVIKMGDLEIIDMMSYMKGLSSFAEGQVVDVLINRNGKEINKKVKF